MKRPYTKQLYELIYKHTRIKPDPQVFLGMVARAQTVDTRPFFFCERPGYEAMFPADASSDKTTVRKTSIIGLVYLFSGTIVCAFSEAAFGEILAWIRCLELAVSFRRGSCFEHWGARLNMDLGHWINN